MPTPRRRRTKERQEIARMQANLAEMRHALVDLVIQITSGQAPMIALDRLVRDFAEMVDEVSPLCFDCGVHTAAMGEFYMVHDPLWEEAIGEDPVHMLCIGCLEERLGRILTAADFSDAPLNQIYPHSHRLWERLTTA